jgi:Helix-turn-helix domain
MSVRLEKRAWAAELPMIDKFVLIFLARLANHAGGSLYPSAKGIAKAIGACPRAVQNAMYRLIGAGYLERTVEANQPGGKRTNEYKLVVDRLPVLEEPAHDMRGSDNVIHLEPTHDMRGTHAPDAWNPINESKKEEAYASVGTPEKPAMPTLEVRQAVEIWNRIVGAVGCPTVRLPLSDKRAKALKARLRELGGDLDAWAAVCRKVAQSPFCRGDGERGWKADIDFACRPGNPSRLLEGSFDRAPARPKQPVRAYAKPNRIA